MNVNQAVEFPYFVPTLMPTECGLERGNETGMFLRLNRTVEVSPDTTDMRALEVRGKRRSASGELPTVGVEIVSISPISNDSALNKGARSCIEYFEVNALHLQSLDGEMNIDLIRAISVQFDEADGIDSLKLSHGKLLLWI